MLDGQRKGPGAAERWHIQEKAHHRAQGELPGALYEGGRARCEKCGRFPEKERAAGEDSRAPQEIAPDIRGENVIRDKNRRSDSIYGKIIIHRRKTQRGPGVCQTPCKYRTGAADGYMESEEAVVTWCVGHLVTMSYPEAYDPKYKRWSLQTLPFLPKEFKYEVIPGVAKAVSHRERPS